MPTSIAVVASAFIAACWLSDVRTRTIPNWLTGGVFVIGLVLNTYLYGSTGLLHGSLGAVAVVVLLLAPFALGGVGGGDVKMMGALGALLGVKVALVGLAAGLILGGFVMAAHLARLGRFGEKMAATMNMFRGALRQGSTDPLRLSDEAVDAVTLPYSIPLGVGVLGAMAAYGVRWG